MKLIELIIPKYFIPKIGNPVAASMYNTKASTGDLFGNTRNKKEMNVYEYNCRNKKKYLFVIKFNKKCPLLLFIFLCCVLNGNL